MTFSRANTIHAKKARFFSCRILQPSYKLRLRSRNVCPWHGGRVRIVLWILHPQRVAEQDESRFRSRCQNPESWMKLRDLGLGAGRAGRAGLGLF